MQPHLCVFVPQSFVHPSEGVLQVVLVMAATILILGLSIFVLVWYRVGAVPLTDEPAFRACFSCEANGKIVPLPFYCVVPCARSLSFCGAGPG